MQKRPADATSCCCRFGPSDEIEEVCKFHAEWRDRIAELEARIERARRQLAVSDQYATGERGSSRVPTTWELQNSLVRDALADK